MMNHRTFTSRKNNNIVPAILWRALQASIVLIILVWIGAAVSFVARDDRKVAAVPSGQEHDVALDPETDRMIALELEVDPQKTITIRISVSQFACPKAYEFLTWMIENQRTECRPCDIYRGEPVPPYWGSEDRPDRWDNGGRWGPPYALVQGGFVSGLVDHVEREAHRPPVRRGAVAWAGPRGVHFFIALADHPEWGDEHTVWGRVLEEDMPLMDGLVDGSRPLKVLERNVPVVTNFVDRMPFRIREYS